jgi:hypothetical protein
MKQSPSSLVFVPGTSMAAVPQLERYVSTTYGMSMRLDVSLQITDSDSPLGPRVTLKAWLVLPSLDVCVFFRDRARAADHPPDEVKLRTSLVEAEQRMQLPAYPLRGLPKWSRLTLVLTDSDGRPLCAEQTLGDCADGFQTTSVSFTAEVGAVAWLAPQQWSERQGARLRVSGELVFIGGVTLRLEFGPSGSPNGGNGKGTVKGAGERGAAEVELVRPGKSLGSSETFLQSGVPNHLWVSVLFEDGQQRPIGDERLVGRCVLL